jgi:tetratricopeptide (TPR) repeat protein
VLAKEEEEWRLVGNLLNNLGLVNRQLKDYASSVKHYKETVKLTKRLGFPFGISAAYINLGDAYKLNGQFLDAMACEDSAITLLRTFDNLEYLQVAYLAKALISINMNDAQNATMYADSVDYYLSLQRVFNNEIDLLNVRAKIAALKGDFKNAYNLNNAYHEHMDSLNTITNQDKLAELQAIYGKERIENDLKEARNQNKLLEQQKELDEANWRMLFLLLAGVSVVIIGFSYIRYVNKLRKQQAYFSQGLINQVDSKEIAELLFVSVKSVENYRSRICKKLNLDARNNSLLMWVMENKRILEQKQ